jgi:uncharacterized membrane protein YkgB
MSTHVEAHRLSQRSVVTVERLALVESTGMRVLRYGLAAILLGFGFLKFAAWEAEAIRPLVSNSPLMSWMYSVLSVQGVSNLIGLTEIAAALLIAARPFAPVLSAAGSALAVGIFATTLSFLFSTPGGLAPMGPVFGFLIKDIGFLGAALVTAAEALRASREAAAARGAS